MTPWWSTNIKTWQRSSASTKHMCWGPDSHYMLVGNGSLKGSLSHPKKVTLNYVAVLWRIHVTTKHCRSEVHFFGCWQGWRGSCPFVLGLLYITLQSGFKRWVSSTSFIVILKYGQPHGCLDHPRTCKWLVTPVYEPFTSIYAIWNGNHPTWGTYDHLGYQQLTSWGDPPSRFVMLGILRTHVSG